MGNSQSTLGEHVPLAEDETSQTANTTSQPANAPAHLPRTRSAATPSLQPSSPLSHTLSLQADDLSEAGSARTQQFLGTVVQALDSVAGDQVTLSPAQIGAVRDGLVRLRQAARASRNQEHTPDIDDAHLHSIWTALDVVRQNRVTLTAGQRATILQGIALLRLRVRELATRSHAVAPGREARDTTRHTTPAPASTNANPEPSREERIRSAGEAVRRLLDNQNASVNRADATTIQEGLHHLRLQPADLPNLRHTGAFRLAGLPPELRDAITAPTLRFDHPIDVNNTAPHIRLPTILREDPLRMESELRRQYFRNNTFRARSMAAAIAFLNSLSPRDRSSIRRLEINRGVGTSQRRRNVQARISRGGGVARAVIFMVVKDDSGNIIHFTNHP